ncbi:PadR family transcriptional regulator [Neobacillus notoginsengisoli]|uniref:PadR family transcriptional regulator n=1 Tax=Neobacillus notoginsengisoli TaxID=1578198 RepID=A0A417YVT7_9BACI|nr:PadR family transcriptional regulator [Neobacillus notoginsengisoli]RHW41475.1 PadR family transcriptional regulator [Neobacillus notoginsengisoli]
MEDRLKKLRTSMKKNTFADLVFTEDLQKEIKKKVKTSFESDEDTTMAILQLLVQERTGFGLVKLLEARGMKRFVENEGSLYTILHQLEKNRLIFPNWESGVKYYRLADKGKKFLAKNERRAASNRLGLTELLGGNTSGT